MTTTIAQSAEQGLVTANPIRQFFRAVAEGFARYMEAQSRMGEITRLQGKSDAELARMGITREGIFSYVFRDRYCF